MERTQAQATPVSLKIEALASADDRTVSSYINRVLRKALENDAKKQGGL